MPEQITIDGETFNVPVRYKEGHVLTAGEAAALDQSYHQNLRNNFTKVVREARAKGGFDLHALQEELDTYAAEYQFGRRRTRGVAVDPIMGEARKVAREQIRDYLKGKGVKVSEVKAASIIEAVNKLITNDPDIMVSAKARLAAAKIAAVKDLSDLVGSLPLKQA